MTEQILPDKNKPIWQRVSTYLALGVPAFIVFLATTKPQDAITNLAGWAKLAGVDRVPVWIATPGADMLAAVSGLVAACGSLIWLVATHGAYRESRRRHDVALDELITSLDRLSRNGDSRHDDGHLS